MLALYKQNGIIHIKKCGNNVADDSDNKNITAMRQLGVR